MPTVKTLVLGCGALAKDLMSLFAENQMQDYFDLQCLPAKLHSTPELIAPEVDKFLAKQPLKLSKHFCSLWRLWYLRKARLSA